MSKKYAKPSEALRASIKLIKRTRGPFFEYNSDGKICKACALGSIAYAVNAKRVEDSGGYPNVIWSILDKYFGLPSLLSNPIEALRCSHPNCDDYFYNYGNCIAHLNDYHGWSRNRIAAWLESVGL